MFAFLWFLLKVLFALLLVIWMVLRLLRPRLIVQGSKSNEVVRVRSGLGWMFMDIGTSFGFVPPLWQLVRALFTQHVLRGEPVCSGKFKVKNVGSAKVNVICCSRIDGELVTVTMLEGLKPGENGVLEVSKVGYPLTFGVESSTD
jgi:hypothetical protein